MLTAPTSARQSTIVVAGVDTHKATHHAAVLDLNGRLLGDREFPATAAGYRNLLDWVAGHGIIDRAGVELTGSYGAGLTRFLLDQQVSVLEVNTTDKATRARRGKDDSIDAIAAAQKVLAGMATAIPKNTTGATEAIRMLTLTRDSAVKDRTAAINQFNALLITAPTQLREQLDRLPPAAALAAARSFRPNLTQLNDPAQAVKQTLKRLAHRILGLTAEIKDADKELATLVQATAPSLVSRHGIGTHTAARFLITAANNLNRIRNEAAFARLCGAAPIPVSSGQTRRMRLSRSGDRQANRALHMIIIGRMKADPNTKAYIAKKLAAGHSKKDAIRALKRFVAREVFNTLKHDLNPTRHP